MSMAVEDLHFIPLKYKNLLKALQSTLLTRFYLGNYEVTWLTKLSLISQVSTEMVDQIFGISNL